MKTQNKIIILLTCIILVSLIVLAEDKVIEVNEGDFVNLKVSASDADKDALSYTYESPLNEKGQWQTDYGDAGEYNIDIIVSDGKTEVTKEVLLIVHRSNRPPILKEINDIVANEGDTIIIDPQAEDEEGDDITYTISEPIGDDGVWETTHHDAGDYIITVTATDNLHEPVTQEVIVVVKDKNQDPEITEYSPKKDVEMYEGEEKTFSISAKDLDNENLKYSWELNNESISTDKVFVYSPDFESAGDYTLKGSVSDGKIKVGVRWNIKVIDKNRLPSIENIEDIIVNEGDLVQVELKIKDPDGDDITYSISDPIGDDKEWQTTYEDAGTHEIELIISDGREELTETFNVIVKDVDRAPEFEEIEDITIKEGETVEINLDAHDPDGDEVNFSAENLPPGASLDENRFIFETNHETLIKPKHWSTRILKFLHLDDLIYRNKGVFEIRFIASGREKSTYQKARITVQNVNRAPILLEEEDIYIDEGETVNINPQAVEKDNDRVKFKISDPVGNDGEWKTGYEDAGIYPINITASDGKIKDSQKIIITVNNINRAPEFNDIKPIEIDEGEDVVISPVVNDPDGDAVEISIEELPAGAKFENNKFIWTPGYDTIDYRGGKITYKLNFTASDYGSTTSKEVMISVNNINRAPEFIETSPAASIRVYTGFPILFKAEAEDPDGDEITYTWKLGLFDQITNSTPGLKRTFTKSGDKKIRLIVSDGDKEITKTWKIQVVEKPVNKVIPKVVEKTETKDQKTETKPKTHTLTIV
ncbi:hypothetical protein GF361_04300 [Candidatus Woesearchaeota archaeon]|nr:hypothetical protein [Candidatus Woesearchaeota archaeon]